MECDPAEREDEKTQFFIKPLTAYQLSVLEGKHSYIDQKNSGRLHFNVSLQAMEMVAASVKDVKNLLDEDGKEIRVQLDPKTKGLTNDFMNFLPP